MWLIVTSTVTASRAGYPTRPLLFTVLRLTLYCQEERLATPAQQGV